MSIAHFTDVFDFPEETAWALRWRFWAAIALIVSAFAFMLVSAALIAWLIFYEIGPVNLIAGGMIAMLMAATLTTAFGKRRPRRRSRVSHI